MCCVVVAVAVVVVAVVVVALCLPLHLTERAIDSIDTTILV